MRKDVVDVGLSQLDNNHLFFVVKKGGRFVDDGLLSDRLDNRLPTSKQNSIVVAHLKILGSIL